VPRSDETTSRGGERLGPNILKFRRKSPPQGGLFPQIVPSLPACAFVTANTDAINRNALQAGTKHLMSKKPAFPIGRPRSSTRPDLTARVETVRHSNEINRRRTIPVQAIAETLVAEGYTSLDKQAKALGIHRSTAWTIIKKRHKLGCLNTKTAQLILANPYTPPSVRAIIQQALDHSYLLQCKRKT
jgi:hypothetical protein